MKKYGYVLIITLTAFILAACGSESKEDVIDSVEDHIDEVETYYADMHLYITGTDANGDVVDEQTIELHADMNETTGANSGELVQNSDVIEYYFTKEAIYAQKDHGGWEIADQLNQILDQSGSEYPDIAHILIDLKEHEDFEMEKKEDTFVFHFEGTSKDVYEVLEEPYSLFFTGIAEGDIQLDVTIVVGSETYYIEKLQANLVAEKAGEKIEMDVGHAYDQFNAIDAVEIPQKVIDEAEEKAALTEEKDQAMKEKNQVIDESDYEDLEKRVFVAKETGVEAKLTYYYEGDKVIVQTAENEILYEELGLSSQEEAKEFFDPVSEQYQGVDGIKQDVFYGADRAVEILEVNYETVDYEQAQEIPGVVIDDPSGMGISMEQSAEMLIEDGYEEIEE